MFLVSGVDDRSATNLGNLFAVSIETPTTNLIATDNVFHKQYSFAEFQCQLVEHVQVLEQILVRGAGVRVLIVMSIDEQLHRWFVCRFDQYRLFTFRCY